METLTQAEIATLAREFSEGLVRDLERMDRKQRRKKKKRREAPERPPVAVKPKPPEEPEDDAEPETDEQKPENCTCAWPEEKFRNGSGHRRDCPVHQEWLARGGFHPVSETEGELHVLPVIVEHPKGSIRAGVTKEGKPWRTLMAHDYGFIPDTLTAADNSEIDIYVGPDPDSQKVFVIDQVDPKTAAWDEHKVMIGFPDEDSAKAGYFAHYPDDWKGFGHITEMTVEEFRDWLDGDNANTPLAEKYQAAEPESEDDLDGEVETIRRYGQTYRVRLVDDEKLRNRSLPDEEFGNFANHLTLPDVPDGEIWIGKDTSPKERPFFLSHAIAAYRAAAHGASPEKAHNIGLAKEKSEREKASGTTKYGQKTIPENLYEEELGKLPRADGGSDLDVWVVDGEKVRDIWETEFVEGGNHEALDFVPDNEIWIEDRVPEDERPVIALHEYVERHLMKHQHLEYPEAHKQAAEVEFTHRGDFSWDKLYDFAVEWGTGKRPNGQADSPIRLNRQGGVVPEDMEKARRADLVTLPVGETGTRCGSCTFFQKTCGCANGEGHPGWCGHTEVEQHVSASRQCCEHWDNPLAYRDWEQKPSSTMSKMAYQGSGPRRHAKGGSGRWITIGGREGADGKRHGGSPVYIENGRITKGHPKLTGKKIGALKEPAEDIGHRKALNQSREHSRAVAAKQARNEGIHPKDLHQLAGEILAHDREYTDDRRKALQRARDLFQKYNSGRQLSHLSKEFKEGDYTTLPNFDQVTDTVQREYPHVFRSWNPNHDSANVYSNDTDYQQELFDMLREGNPEPMAEADAYQKALDELRYHQQSATSHKIGNEPEAPGDSWEGEPQGGAADDFDFPVPSESGDAIPPGESRYLDGYFVSNHAGTYHLQTDRGAINGTPEEIQDYIHKQRESRKHLQPMIDAALQRAQLVAGGSFFGGGTEHEAEAFGRIPEGEPVVSLAADTHGRLGKIVKRDGQNAVKLDGTPGYASNDVEPLDRRWSWRQPLTAKERPSEPEQKRLFQKDGWSTGLIRYAAAEPEDKARRYADLFANHWNGLESVGRQVPERELHDAGLILGDSDWVVSKHSDGEPWQVIHHVEFHQQFPDVAKNAVEHYERHAVRAPKGGVHHQGKFYRGGQFVPVSWAVSSSLSGEKEPDPHGKKTGVKAKAAPLEDREPGKPLSAEDTQRVREALYGDSQAEGPHTAEANRLKGHLDDLDEMEELTNRYRTALESGRVPLDLEHEYRRKLDELYGTDDDEEPAPWPVKPGENIYSVKDDWKGPTAADLAKEEEGEPEPAKAPVNKESALSDLRAAIQENPWNQPETPAGERKAREAFDRMHQALAKADPEEARKLWDAEPNTKGQAFPKMKAEEEEPAEKPVAKPQPAPSAARETEAPTAELSYVHGVSPATARDREKKFQIETDRQNAVLALGNAKTDEESQRIIGSLSPEVREAVANTYDAPHLADNPTATKLRDMARGESPNAEPPPKKRTLKDAAREGVKKPAEPKTEEQPATPPPTHKASGGDALREAIRANHNWSYFLNSEKPEEHAKGQEMWQNIATALQSIDPAEAKQVWANEDSTRNFVFPEPRKPDPMDQSLDALKALHEEAGRDPLEGGVPSAELVQRVRQEIDRLSGLSTPNVQLVAKQMGFQQKFPSKATALAAIRQRIEGRRGAIDRVHA